MTLTNHYWNIAFRRSAICLCAALCTTAIVACGGKGDDSDPSQSPHVDTPLEIFADVNSVLAVGVTATDLDPNLGKFRMVAAAMVATRQSGIATSGRTFVVDESRLPNIVYVPDDTRTQVPSDRTRFVLYDVGSFFQLATPLTESGAVDIALSPVMPPTGNLYLVPGAGDADIASTGTLDLVPGWTVARRAGSILANRSAIASGTLHAAGISVPFEYSDRITTSGSELLFEDRNLRLTTPGGLLIAQSYVGTDMKYSDSDSNAELQVELPLHLIRIKLGAIRGNGPYVDSITIDGDASRLRRTDIDCTAINCFTLDGQRVNSPVLDEFNEQLRGWFANMSPGYFPPSALEALAAPGEYALAAP